MFETTWDLAINPAWRPFFRSDFFGYVALAGAGLLLILLTLWAYLGSSQTTPRRLTLLICLRLLALILAVLTTLRPSLSLTEEPKLPSTLIVAIDDSESMGVRDAAIGSRWEEVIKTIERSEPLLKELQDEQQFTIQMYRFSRDFDPKTALFDPTNPGESKGKRTEFRPMMQKLYDTHQADRNLRGLIILSDGIDNADRKLDLADETKRWRNLGCPIYTFAIGQTGTRSELKDLALTAINPVPSPVSVKSDVEIEGRINAVGFEGATVNVQLLFDDQLISTQKVKLDKPKDNRLTITTKAPEKPGEVKVTLRIVDGPAGETTLANNSIETYLTVNKGGIRILVVDRLREELAYLRNVLATDKRIDYVEVIRQTDEPLTPAEAEKFDLAREGYDVIILGDVSAARLKSIRPDFLQQLQKLVLEKGIGLMMLGGVDTFGGSPGVSGSGDWNGTEVAQILPVTFKPTNQVAELTRMEPTNEGYFHFLMRLDADATKSKALWKRLTSPKTQLDGFTPLGEAKPGAIVFAKAYRKGDEKGVPILVGQDVGKGRTLAFGADTTGRKWRRLGMETPANPREGLEVHARFWKQVLLWLAHQDEVEGNVYVRPELRRMSLDSKQTFRLGIRDKRGEEVLGGNLLYQVLSPGEEADRSKGRTPKRDASGQYRPDFQPPTPGEYRVVAWADAKDKEGGEIKGMASASFLVYPEISEEMLQIAANHDFLRGLENAINGTALDTVRRVDQLPQFLEQLKANPLKPSFIKPRLYPNWKRGGNPYFLPSLLVAFVMILATEWGLRRIWGMA
jgi:uncharacterized membrane protein